MKTLTYQRSPFIQKLRRERNRPFHRTLLAFVGLLLLASLAILAIHFEGIKIASARWLVTIR